MGTNLQGFGGANRLRRGRLIPLVASALGAYRSGANLWIDGNSFHRRPD
jgi:hypothetical protein